MGLVEEGLHPLVGAHLDLDAREEFDVVAAISAR